MKPASDPGTAARVGRVALAVALVLWFSTGLLLLGGVSWYRAFQVDEVEHLHAGYHMASDRTLYTEFWQPHNPLLYWLLGPVVNPEEPVASYRAGRLMMLGLLLVNIALCALAGGVLARRVLHRDSAGREDAGGGRERSPVDPWGAALAAGLALSHTTLVERGMEVRPDGLLSLAIAAALLAEISGWRRDRLRHSVAGALLGLGFLATQKAAFASFAFGCLWLWRAARRRCPGLVLWPVIAWTLPLAAAALSMTLTGNFHAYLELNILDAFDTVSGAEHRSPFSPISHLLRESSRNLLFVVLGAYGIVRGLRTWPAAISGLLRAKRGEEEDGGGAGVLAFPAFLALFSIGSLWANPFPWPYVHVTVVPPVVVLAAGAVAGALPRPGRGSRGPLVLALLLLASLGSAPRLASKALPLTGYGSQSYQLELLEEIQRITEPDDTVFDLAGLYFRPDGYRAYALSGDLFGWYRRGGMPPIEQELAENGTVVVVQNYRTQWLGPERRLIQEAFTHYHGNLYVLGRDLSGAPAGVEIPFRVLKTKPFRYEGPGTLEIGGEPFRRGVLARGTHLLRLD
ncbi:MAG: hypothetical protein MI919_17325, partial [Holophagales bacterium]|nr:hypothetical protein [Holophagales bacterium]